jgi:integrase
VLLQLIGSTPAVEFGPKKLKLVRDEMVRGNLEVEHPRKPWSRKYANGQIQRICAVFKWAASHEMLPASIYEQFKTLPSLKRGRCNAREGRKIKAVPIHQVEATRPFLSRQADALVSLQLLTGARGGELLQLRPIDIVIDKKQGIWTFTPEEHKTAHHGHQRTIYFGERAQQLIEPFLADRPLDAFLFQPRGSGSRAVPGTA